MGESADGRVPHNAATIEDFLELGGYSGTVMGHQLSLASNVGGVHRPQLQLR
jgi:hypothetical protein